MEHDTERCAWLHREARGWQTTFPQAVGTPEVRWQFQRCYGRRKQVREAHWRRYWVRREAGYLTPVAMRGAQGAWDSFSQVAGVRDRKKQWVTRRFLPGWVREAHMRQRLTAACQ